MKRTIAPIILAVLSLFLVLICACTNDVAVQADASVLSEITTAYYNKYKDEFSSEYYTYTADDISIRYYGEYGGTHVMFIDVPFFAYGEAITNQTVGGVKFTYSNTHKLEAYRSGEFYSLESAFENGYLSRADLKQIRNKHKNQYHYMYS